MSDRLNSLITRAYLATRKQDGQTMTEYALILGIIAAATLTIIGVMSGQITNKFQSICTQLKGSAC